jgi:hypothetical protein
LWIRDTRKVWSYLERELGPVWLCKRRGEESFKVIGVERHQKLGTSGEENKHGKNSSAPFFE